jgi:hypothetical protein
MSNRSNELFVINVLYNLLQNYSNDKVSRDDLEYAVIHLEDFIEERCGENWQDQKHARFMEKSLCQ